MTTNDSLLPGGGEKSMSKIAILGLLVLATLAIPVAAAQPLPRQFSFGGTGTGGGYTATVVGTGTVDPANKMVTVSGTATVTDTTGTAIVSQSFGQTTTWDLADPPVISLEPIEGLVISVTIVPGQPATVAVTVP